jgi:hypothetical protein
MNSLRDFTKAAMYGVPENLMKLEQVPTAALTETVQMLRGEPYDFRNVNPNFGQFGSNQRDLSVLGYENPEGFMQNAVNMGLSAIDPAMLTSLASPVVRGAIRTGVNLGDELATAQLRSIKNVGKDVSDKVRYVEDLRRMGLERSQDVPALENVDQIKGLRKFGQNLEEVYMDYVKKPFVETSKVNDFLKKANELRTESESLTSKGVLKQIDRKNIDAILSRADQLSKYNNEEFIDKFSKYMTPGMNQIFKENPELGENYMRAIQQMNMTDPDEIGMYINNTFNDNFDDLTFEKTYGSRTKSKDFNPDFKTLHNYKVADEPSFDRKSLYRDDSGKLFTDKNPASASSKDSNFYSTEFYKNLGDRLTNLYADYRLKNSSIVPELPSKGVDTAELIPSLFATRQDAKAIMFKASKFTDATDDMAFIPASSLSSDSYPLGLQMMQGSLKRNPGSKINFYGYSPMNDFGYATKLVNDPNLLRSELSGYVSDLQKVAGRTLPKPYMDKYGDMMIPKFALSKGQVTKDIDDYLKNTSIGQRLRLNSPIMKADLQPQVSDPGMANLYNLHNLLNANRNRTVPPDFDTSIFNSSDMDIFKKGGVIKDNRGQLNHPGEITEIDSPYITMQGVPYNVLGISDTGDTKLMEPGKDYKFKGKKVTEFPLKAQEGIKVPEVEGSTLPEVLVTDMPERISRQNQLIQGTSPKRNYSIVDKKNNYIYYFSPKGEKIGTEPIITGASNNDVDVSPSMREFFEMRDTDNHEEYFQYLKDTKGQTTPSGIYSISGLRTDTAKNPDKLGSLFNKLFRPEREKEIEDIRIKDYGAQQNLFTLQSEFGVPSSKAIHGTMRDDRVDALENYDRDRNMSNGCVNVNGETMCFETLEKGSGVYILPEESDDLLYPSEKNNKERKTNKNYRNTRSTIAQELLSRGIEPEKEALDFIASVAEKETKGGRSKFAAVEQFAPHALAKSQGKFQIDPSAFKQYLPEDYDGSDSSGAEAVYNFFNENKEIDPVNMYRKYTGDEKGKYDKKFKSIYDKMSIVYRDGGRVGINDLDAQPKKKLNQLLNFTNNPDKDWLKKYQ